jgi:hypothetical protein
MHSFCLLSQGSFQEQVHSFWRVVRVVAVATLLQGLCWVVCLTETEGATEHSQLH